MFSPWRYLIDREAASLLETVGWNAPDPDAYPTGHELIEDYLLPLATVPQMQAHLLFRSRVLSQEESLLYHLKKKFVVATTNSRHGFRVYPNELAGVTLSAPDQAWVADFTYIRLRSAFVYLACLLDAFSRRCVGWHLSREMTTQLTCSALHQAIKCK